MTDFTILTVCTGNVCRSPLAEQLLRSGLQHLPTVRVRSAGTAALVGEPMPPQAVALSLRHGGVGSAVHLGQQATAEVVASADLVLGATREHRRGAVELVPRLARVSFTLREFARLVGALDAADEAELALARGTTDRLRLLVDLAASHRGLVIPPADPADDDIIDPFRRSDEVYEQSASQLVPAVEAIVRALAAASEGGRS
jgi:protein-tyrosine phosphatase